MDVEAIIRDVISRSSQHQNLYHLTDAANLPSIRTHGLLSLREIEKRGIAIADSAADEQSRVTDREKGIDRFVHLSFTTGNPMFYKARSEQRLKSPVMIQVNPRVMLIEGSQITLGFANKTGIDFHEVASMDPNLIDFEIIYTRTDWRQSEFKNRLDLADKFEILIPDHIPIEMIVRFVSW